MEKNVCKYLILILILCVCGCQVSSKDRLNEHLSTAVVAHENLLRQHFLGQPTGHDISALLNTTTDIADQLRGLGRLKDARRFDSYRDVLMYGQYTIDESINDVQRLVDYGFQGHIH